MISEDGGAPGIVRYSIPPTLEILRGALPKDAVDKVRDNVRQLIGNRAAPADGQSEVHWSVNLDLLLDKGNLRHPGQIIGLVAGTGVTRRCREILGPDIVCSLQATIIRDFRPDHRSEPARMHFDANLFGPSVPMLNVWVPLNDVGRDSPGLTMATVPHWPRPYWDRMVGMANEDGLLPGGAWQHLNFPPAEILARAGEEPEWPFFEPELAVGDVMIFDHQFIHGTQVTLTSAGRRFSLEIRFLSRGSAERYSRHKGRPMRFATID